MTYIFRQIQPFIQRALNRGKSVLLLGARQTGKTTLLKQFNPTVYLNFAQPDIRLQFEKSKALLHQRIEALPKTTTLPLIVLDEIQKIPELLDAAQDLIDRQCAQFIFTGSSARKLRQPKINWLPGRVVPLHLDPLMLSELPESQKSLEQLLLFGTLPGIVTTPLPEDQNIDLHAYVSTYLEEEIRSEAAVRQVGTFAQFLELAASESGRLVNFSKLSQELGIAHSTVAGYYQILEDCLIAERIEPFLKASTRKRLSKSKKYLIFDLGVRRFAAHEGESPQKEHWGHLFEQWVGLELLKKIRLYAPLYKLCYWRDLDGPEVDWVIVKDNQDCIPIEVKWSEHPTEKDLRHIHLFCELYDCPEGFIICRSTHRLKLSEKITAIPWQEIDSIV